MSLTNVTTLFSEYGHDQLPGPGPFPNNKESRPVRYLWGQEEISPGGALWRPFFETPQRERPISHHMEGKYIFYVLFYQIDS